MKPSNTLLELADTALPLFGDPERDYDYVSSVSSLRNVAGGIEADVESFEGRAARLRLQFVTPEVLRIQYVLDREPPASTPMLVGLPEPARQVDVTEDDGGVMLASSSLCVRLARDPARWSLLGPSGETVVRQEVHDGAAGQFISVPAGWSRQGDGPPDLHETLALRPDEALYGLGESFFQLNRRGTRAVAWSRDPNGTNTTPLTYLNIPFFMSTRGYGVFINHTSRIVYELGYPSQIAASWRVEDPYLDYFVIYGPGPREILERYWRLTGQAALPPLWSFGVWMSRCMYRDGEQVRGVVERMRELDIPLDVVHVDPRWLEDRKHRERDGCDFVWDRAAFAEPDEFVRWLRDRNVRLSLWENPYVWRDTDAYRAGVERGYFAVGPDGKPAPSLDNSREAVVVDFTNREAVRWWQDMHRSYLRAGVASFKSDYGEAVPPDARFADGTTGRQTHNVYPLLYNRAVWEVIQEERGEAVLFGRSGYAGSQRYPINWVGDTQSTWEGMAAALRAGLSLSLSGIPFWSHDIGGFWNPADVARGPDPDLYVRWSQWGLLSSHARFHGVRGREPWWYGDDAVDIVRRFARLRYRLMPYLWSCANEAVERAVPVARPLWFDYPDDPTTFDLDLQYLFGPWLLVAPVFEPSGHVRAYLPEGRWFDFWSDQAVDGPRWLDLLMPLDRLPLYVRDDSLLPVGPEMTFVEESPWRPLELDVRVSNEASLRIDGPGASIEALARRERDGVTIELSGTGELVLRLRAPAPNEFDVSGGASAVREVSNEAGTALRLTLDGEAAVRSK